MLRVLVVGLPFYRDDWRPAIWVLAVLSLVVGSFLAVVQTDVKRMLAYSSISHAGFILVGVEAAAHRAGEVDSGLGVPSVLVYLLAYAVLVVGTFGVVAARRPARRRRHRASTRSAASASQRPLLALALTVFLVAQAGVPFTSGFIAKFGVIQAAVDEQQLRAGGHRHGVVGRRRLPVPADHGQRRGWPIRRPRARRRSRCASRSPRAWRSPPPWFTLVVGIFPDWLLDAAETTTTFAR